MKTQKELILDFIAEHGSITPMQAFSKLGITKLATRISELKVEGHKFRTDTVSKKRKNGRSIRFCRYSMEEANG